jgi:hypothetical protein
MVVLDAVASKRIPCTAGEPFRNEVIEARNNKAKSFPRA